jgi:4-hydroxy 2-oxovalerate aldolase
MLEEIQKRGSLLSYRKDIRVMDCTIRDGGLMNDFKFEEEFVKNVYKACVKAGVDYMEFGYKGSRDEFETHEYGPWKYTSEKDLRKIVGENNTELKISVMADVGRTNFKEDVLPRSESVIDMIRTACYINQIPAAIEMMSDFHQKGYETCINIMAISNVSEGELDEALEILGQSEVDCIYLVDSFGAFYPEQIRSLAKQYLAIGEKYNKTIGIHAHNNQQLAFANTIEALTLGVSMIDATVSSLGRGAGNCPLELLLGFLKNPKYSLRPILGVVENDIPRLKEKGMVWGYDIPYMLTGAMNQHPRAALKLVGTDKWKQFIDFYDEMTREV